MKWITKMSTTTTTTTAPRYLSANNSLGPIACWIKRITICVSAKVTSTFRGMSAYQQWQSLLAHPFQMVKPIPWVLFY
jgi:hypothetical protein